MPTIPWWTLSSDASARQSGQTGRLQPFSAWDRIFPDRAVAVAAIDRLVHHATILEMNVDSYRRRAAADRSAAKADALATTAGDNLADSQHHADSDNLRDIREDLTA